MPFRHVEGLTISEHMTRERKVFRDVLPDLRYWRANAVVCKPCSIPIKRDLALSISTIRALMVVTQHGRFMMGAICAGTEMLASFAMNVFSNGHNLQLATRF